jgi:hypothetical protein
VVGNARPSPSFTIQEEFGNQLDETFLDRSFRSKFGKKEPTRQSLDSIRRTIFFKRVETCIIHPLLMRGWTIDSLDDSQVQLRAGETDTSQSLRSEGLDAELVIRHPWYTTEEGTDTIGALITEEKIWTRQLKSGVLCLKDASGLDGWHQNEPRLHSWDPLKDSIDDLLQQEATAAEERPAQGGSTPNDAKETDFEMPESVTAGTESTSVVVGKTASMMYDGAVAGAASGTNTDAESMICDIDKKADTEYGAGAGAASGTAGSGDKTLGPLRELLRVLTRMQVLERQRKGQRSTELDCLNSVSKCRSVTFLRPLKGASKSPIPKPATAGFATTWSGYRRWETMSLQSQ